MNGIITFLNLNLHNISEVFDELIMLITLLNYKEINEIGNIMNFEIFIISKNILLIL